MKITEFHLKNFGKFSEQRIVLHSGINLIYGENEAGKTTLHTFIRGMLFGIERQRGKASKNDTYSLYEPWVHPSYYAGMMKFECQNKLFRLERSFHKNDKTAHLICETDGEELSLEHGDLEMILGGLNENLFDNTVSVGQMKSVAGKTLAAELKNYAANYYETRDFELDLDKAIQSLRADAKRFNKKKAEEQKRQEEHRKKIRARMSYIDTELREKKSLMNSLKDKAADTQEKVRKKKAELSQKVSVKVKPEVVRESASIWYKVIGGALILGAVAMFIFSGWKYTLILEGIMAVIGCLLLMKRGKLVPVGPQRQKVEPDEEVQAKGLEEEYKKVLWQVESLAEEIKEKQTSLDNLQEELDEQEELSDKAKKAERGIQAAELAMDTIRDLAGDIQNEQGSFLNNKASEILAEITEGKYTRIVIGEDLAIKINTPDKLLNVEQVSRGTVEQIYFALRMAVSEMMFQEEEIPVILDDTFVMYDEERLHNTLRWLGKSNRQVILFSCHKREQQLMERQGIVYHRVM